MAQKLKIRLAVRIYRAATMKRSVFLMAHLFFTAESKAIDMALDYVMNNSLENKFVIFSDSLSVLKSLNHTSSKKSQNPERDRKNITSYQKTKENFVLFGSPSHVGIKGNEAADVKAKASLDLENFEF